MLISFIQIPHLQNKFKSVRSSRPEVFLKKTFLKISQNSLENTYARVFSNKVASLRPATLLKRDSGTGVFL